MEFTPPTAGCRFPCQLPCTCNPSLTRSLARGDHSHCRRRGWLVSAAVMQSFSGSASGCERSNSSPVAFATAVAVAVAVACGAEAVGCTLLAEACPLHQAGTAQLLCLSAQPALNTSTRRPDLCSSLSGSLHISAGAHAGRGSRHRIRSGGGCAVEGLGAGLDNHSDGVWRRRGGGHSSFVVVLQRCGKRPS